jgi:hypothetical protein
MATGSGARAALNTFATFARSPGRARTTEASGGTMNIETFLMIVGAVLALPGGLFVAYLISVPRARLASLVGGIIGGGLTALGIYYFTHASNVTIDGLSYTLGVFFGTSIGVVIGALVANFIVGAGSRSRDLSSAEL